MTNKRNRLAALFSSRLAFPVKKVQATRAIFEGEDRQRIDVAISLEYGERLTLELTPKQAHELITQLTNAYTAINPPLRGQGWAGGWGMQ